MEYQEKTLYVLLTDKDRYFVEYLLKQLILSESISEAMTFDNYHTAIKFQQMLKSSCKLNCSVNTYING